MAGRDTDGQCGRLTEVEGVPSGPDHSGTVQQPRPCNQCADFCQSLLVGTVSTTSPVSAAAEAEAVQDACWDSRVRGAK